MGKISLERKIKGHRIVVTLHQSELRAITRVVPPAPEPEQQEAMDIRPLIAGGVTRAEALEHVMDLVTAWIKGRDVKET